MTWSPLACGIVSGKYDSGIPPYSRASLKVSTAECGREALGIRMWIQAFLSPVGSAPGKQAHEPLPYLGIFHGSTFTVQAGPLMYGMLPTRDCPTLPLRRPQTKLQSLPKVQSHTLAEYPGSMRMFTFR